MNNVAKPTASTIPLTDQQQGVILHPEHTVVNLTRRAFKILGFKVQNKQLDDVDNMYNVHNIFIYLFNLISLFIYLFVYLFIYLCIYL